MPTIQPLEIQLANLSLEIYPKGNHQYYIPKQTYIPLTFIPNHFYLIELADGGVATELLNNAAINWNQGRQITSRYLKCEYLRSLGEMDCLNASGYDPDLNLDLSDIYLNIWINHSIIKIVQEL